MPTENQSPSYLRDREAFFRFVDKTPDGKLFKDNIKRFSPSNAAANEWEDGRWVDYDSAMQEAKNGVMVATNCAQLRTDVENARQGRSTLGLPGGSSMHRIGQVPAWYYWRRVQETNDDEYWNNPKNNLYELLFRIPEYSVVPRQQLMAEWEQMKPASTKRFDASGKELSILEAKNDRRAGSGPQKFDDLPSLCDYTGTPVEQKKAPELLLPASVAPKQETPCIVTP
jgi:hypothetical protein